MRRGTSAWAACALTLLLAAAGAVGAAVDDVSEGGNALDGGWEAGAEGVGADRQGKGASMGALGRSVLVELARQLVTNPATNSQVLSLNLTNLLILLVLKALLFGAGMFSFGLLNHKGGHAASRSDQGSSWLPTFTEGELLLALSFLAGDNAATATQADIGPRGRSASGSSPVAPYACMQRIACEQPDVAGEYAGAARIALKAAKMFESIVSFNPKYESIVSDLQKAVDYGRNGGACKERFSCAR